MMLDTLGVGLRGTSTPVFDVTFQYSKVHSMDFDDTWHPATHPSGAVLPALLALAESLPYKLSGLDLLLAFNVGLEIQGRLMRFSKEAHNIPKRFHPPSVVGVMGSAAATAKLLGLSPSQTIAALAIACSSAGAPLANAATQTKPLHLGYAASRGLEASQLALLGLEGNKHILDLESGFSIFYQDYFSSNLTEVSSASQYKWVLEEQDVAFKRFPAHLGMHWVADAAINVRNKIHTRKPNADLSQITRIVLRVPSSRYIDCPFPVTDHEARHSYQFNCCSALLDGMVTVDSFSSEMMKRKALKDMLLKVHLENPKDNQASFEKMYAEVVVEMANSETHTAHCHTFYGHWRKPLNQEHLVEKFKNNASTVLSSYAVDSIVQLIDSLETVTDCSELWSSMQFHKNIKHNKSFYSASA
ncbi:Cis-aconitate decarboxylase [Bagarius yarrelli]|uniref:Cis-aconitate decarboxylase n=1 Tax=Bagarius yarrelli TaxID=175774 RepID=A0A556U4U3_BAGYA|nr:Cis-aconitate decarboxylase [Bagarius yarrelli]